MNLIREEMLIGADAVAKLANSHVAVFGLGGVGSFCVEALARAGVGTLTLVDDDVIDDSNVNRQLFALTDNVGCAKTDVAAQRVAAINPQCVVTKKQIRYQQNTADQFDLTKFDYVVDAIDTVTSKLLLAELCFRQNVPIVSCMGTGNKLDPTAFAVADVFQTKVCPLAKVMRRELKKRGVTKLKVVYSPEETIVPQQLYNSAKRQTPGSVSFVPPVAGMILAGEVIKDIIGYKCR